MQNPKKGTSRFMQNAKWYIYAEKVYSCRIWKEMGKVDLCRTKGRLMQILYPHSA